MAGGGGSAVAMAANRYHPESTLSMRRWLVCIRFCQMQTSRELKFLLERISVNVALNKTEKCKWEQRTEWWSLSDRINERGEVRKLILMQNAVIVCVSASSKRWLDMTLDKTLEICAKGAKISIKHSANDRAKLLLRKWLPLLSRILSVNCCGSWLIMKKKIRHPTM